MLHERIELELPIAGFQPTSLIDYPGGVFSSIIFIGGCNFHCGYCHNPSLKKKPPRHEWLDLNEIIDRLEKKRTWVNAVVITGGEPLLYKETLELIDILLNKGFNVKVDTNGSFPERLRTLIEEQKPSYIAMDVKTSLSRYGELGILCIDKKIAESINLLKSIESLPNYEFRTTLCPYYVGEEELIEISDLVNPYKWVWQQFNPKVTLDPQFSKIQPYSRDQIASFQEIIKEKTQIDINVRGLQ